MNTVASKMHVLMAKETLETKGGVEDLIEKRRGRTETEHERPQTRTFGPALDLRTAWRALLNVPKLPNDGPRL